MGHEITAATKGARQRHAQAARIRSVGWSACRHRPELPILTEIETFPVVATFSVARGSSRLRRSGGPREAGLADGLNGDAYYRLNSAQIGAGMGPCEESRGQNQDDPRRGAFLWRFGRNRFTQSKRSRHCEAGNARQGARRDQDARFPAGRARPDHAPPQDDDGRLRHRRHRQSAGTPSCFKAIDSGNARPRLLALSR